MNRLLYIEILRFFSSLSVLIFHYPIFFNTQSNPPLKNFLEPLYHFGGSGVLIFWAISGYIFYYIYNNKLIDGNITFKTFVVNRFSRLYPLHFLTLILVVILQAIHFDIYDNYHHDYLNDFYHFFLNIFFISFWGFEEYYSFNGPIWSVSVEILVYFLFFYSIFYFKKPLIICLLVIFTSALIKIFSDATHQLLNCLIFFYTGSLAYLFNKFFDEKNISLFKSKIYFILLIIFPYIFWKTKIYEIKYFIFIFFWLYSFFLLIGASISFNLTKKIKKILNNLGNLTYGIYLFHFPLTILIKLIYNFFNLKIPVHSIYFLMFYTTLVILISFVFFHKFEKPMQKFLRTKLS